MKLKREYLTYLTKCLSAFKGLLVLGIFLCMNALTAQQVNVVLLNGPAAEQGLQTATFRLTISSTSGLPVSINYSLTGTAVQGVDYQNVGPVEISPGANQVDVIITPIDDTSIEGNQDVIFTVLNSQFFQYVVGGSPQASTLIGDNDIGVVTLAATIPAASEEGQAIGRFQIQLSGPNETGLPLVVIGGFAGDATPGSDYTSTGNGNFTNATQVAKNITINPVDDSEIEDLETVTYTLTSVNNAFFELGAGMAITADVTIEDNDCAAGENAPTLNASADTEFCDQASVDLNTFVVGNPPAGSVLRWSTNSNPTATNLLPNPIVSTTDTYYGVFWDSVRACASPSLEVDLTFSIKPSAGTTTDASACNNADDNFMPRRIDLDDLIVDADPGDWIQTDGPSVGNIPNSNEINFDDKPNKSRPRPPGLYVFTYTTTGAVAPCTNSSSTVTITVTDCDPCTALDEPVLNSIPTIFCGPIPNSVSLNDYAPNTGPNNNPLKWANDQTDLIGSIIDESLVQNPLPGTWYGFYHDVANDCASPEVALTLASNTVPTIISTAGEIRCAPGTVTLSASVSDNATINWYASATSIIIVATGANFSPNVIQTTSFWVEATSNTCVSPREEVVAEVVPQPSAGIPQNGGNASACSDIDNGPTIVNLDDLIVGEDLGAWVLTSGPLGESISFPLNNSVDFENRADGNYVFTFTTTGAQAPCLNETSVITVSVNDCDVDTDLDGLFDGPEATLGTNPNNPDSDGDGLDDSEEVGADIENPLDEDEDGIIDALDSNILDTDLDGIVDQLDPANTNPCLPNRFNGSCDTDGDGISDLDEQTQGSDPDDPCDPNATPNCDTPIDLEILKVVDNENALIGDEVTFTITATNLDAARKARAIVVGDMLEFGFEYISHEALIGNYDLDSGEWNILELNAGTNATLAITALILEGGPYTNTATLLESIPIDANEGNNEATVEVLVDLPEGIDLVIEKTAISSNPLVNDEVIFTIKITNASLDELPITAIEVEDFIAADSGFVFIDYTTLIGVYDSTTGIWSIESLNRGQEAILEIRVSVPNEGRFTNTAQIRRSSPADGNPANNEATVEVNVSLPTPGDVGFLYNQFSPNNDGTNEALTINSEDPETGLEMPILYTIQIFNRYGNLVFEANNKTDNEIWDGSWKGKDAPDGTYFYTMSIDIGNGPEPKKGWIQLIR